MVQSVSGLWNMLNPNLLKAMLEKKFQDADTDGDGSISQNEMAQVLAAKGKDPAAAEEIIAESDTNGDGLLDQEEQSQAIQRRLNQLEALNEFFNDDNSEEDEKTAALLSVLDSVAGSAKSGYEREFVNNLMGKVVKGEKLAPGDMKAALSLFSQNLPIINVNS